MYSIGGTHFITRVNFISTIPCEDVKKKKKNIGYKGVFIRVGKLRSE